MFEAGEDNSACYQLLKLQMDRILVKRYCLGKLKDNANVLENQCQVVDKLPGHGKEPATCKTVRDCEWTTG